MDTTRPTSVTRAVSQWYRLRDTLVELGHAVHQITPVPGLPDIVFTANGALVSEDRVLVARFRHPQRAAEAVAHLEWFQLQGYQEVRQASVTNEGEGDFLSAGKLILADAGFRSDPRSHDEVRAFFGREVLSLTLVDPRFYHLDTALAVLDDEDVMYLPEVFSPEGRALLADRYPDAVIASEDEACLFGLNAVSDGHHVLLPTGAKRLAAQLRERGYETIGIDTTELLKAGGGAKCCTLEQHGATRDGGQI
jgi:N-dimethylarginine dimethylaminohydrolase